MNIIVMGPPGSGKTTQAKLLAKKLDVPNISTGDIYRVVAKENSELGRKVKAVMDSGELLDDQTTFQIIDRHLGEIKGGFVIDGFPRTLIQAQRNVFAVDKVFYLRLDDGQAVKRLLLRQRNDDTSEIISERLRLYHQDTEPILNYYRTQDKLVETDGGKTVEEVYQLILQALND